MVVTVLFRGDEAANSNFVKAINILVSCVLTSKPDNTFFLFLSILGQLSYVFSSFYYSRKISPVC